MVGDNQNLNGSRHLTTPISGMFAICGLALATISLSTKYEVSISNRHIDITGDTKCQKLALCGTDSRHFATDGPYQLQSHATQKLGQISKNRPDQI